MVGVYGQLGDYQTAYDYFKKAHELNSKKTNPVYGLMMTTRDLGLFDECLS